ncbi:MAG: DUF488 domain-containing protein [Vicinamibacteria bacterium]
MIHTVGHSTRAIADFIALVREGGVRTLVDVRRQPFSRRHPQFSRDALARSLAEAGIAYVHEIDLGGHREPRADSPNTAWRNEAFRGYADNMETTAFQDALARTAALAHAAVMCAEARPLDCHRQLLADALVARGIAVRHLIAPGTVEDHRLHPRAVRRGDVLVYPAAGQLTF